MGKLIILSGPSGVGKGPLVKTLDIYLCSIKRKLHRHILYTTRIKKMNEVHQDTYFYSYLMNVNERKWGDYKYDKVEAESNLLLIKEEAINKGEEFLIFSVREEQNQGINFSELHKNLKDNDVVLLEIFQKCVDDVISFCAANPINGKPIDVIKVFISPLSDDDYKALGCKTEKRRAIATEATMTVKLRSREREGEDKIKERANTAIKEVEEARKRRRKEKYIVNHFGEDMKSAWTMLQTRVGSVPEYYEYGKKTSFSLTGEIDKTFRKFLEKVFPEIPKHNCINELNGNTCRICGKLHS